MPAASRRRSTKRTPRFIVRDAIKQALAYRRKHRDKMISWPRSKSFLMNGHVRFLSIAEVHTQPSLAGPVVIDPERTSDDRAQPIKLSLPP
jgi:hypothetical protein